MERKFSMDKYHLQMQNQQCYSIISFLQIFTGLKEADTFIYNT